jgi:hypothetical protein
MLRALWRQQYPFAARAASGAGATGPAELVVA